VSGMTAEQTGGVCEYVNLSVPCVIGTL